MASPNYFSTYVSLKPSGRNTTLSPKKNGRTPGDNTQEFLFDIGSSTWTSADNGTVDAVCKSISGSLQECAEHEGDLHPVIGKQVIKTISFAFDYPSQKIRILAEPFADFKKPIPVMFSGLAIFSAKPGWLQDSNLAAVESSTKPRKFVSK